MTINPITDNIDCDVCGKDCGYQNDGGVLGADRKGIERDICPECAKKHELSTCANCNRLEKIRNLDPDGFECPVCRERCTCGHTRSAHAQNQGHCHNTLCGCYVFQLAQKEV